MAISQRTLWIACAGIAALLQVAGCSRGVDPERALAEARKFHDNGEIRAAFIQLRNTLQKRPDNAEARFRLGSIYNDVGIPLAGEKELRKAQELGYDPARVLPLLMTSLVMQGQYQRVLDETRLGPKSAEIHVVRGSAELALGRLANAAGSFDEALDLKPQFAPARLGQARLALVEKKPDKANEVVEGILAATPKDVEAWLLLADLRRLRDNDEGAIAAYDQALQIQPENVTALLRRALLQTNSGKFDAAQADIDAARRVIPGSPDVDYTQAMLLFRWGKPRPALESVQRVLRVAPEHMPSVLLAGVLEYLLDSPQLAERYVMQFIDRNPDNLFARKLLVFILLKSDEGERAVRALEPALKQAPRDPQVLALAGEVYMQQRQIAKATAYLEQSAALVPSDAHVRTQLAMTRLALGDSDRAVVELESAVVAERGDLQAETLLVMTYIRKREFDKALHTALELRKKRPDDPVVHNLVGGAYLGKKDLPNARKSLERALSLQADYMPAAIVLSRLDLQANDADGARKRFNAILAKDPKNVQAMIGLASIDRATGNVGGYVSWLEKARSEDSAALAPRILLARYYLQANDPNKAIFVANEAGNLQPNHPDVLNALAEAQAASGDTSAAAQTYARLAAAVPQSPLAQYRLAMAQMAANDYASAEVALLRALELKSDYVDAKAALAMLEYRSGRYDGSLKLAQQIQRHDPKLPIGYILEGDSLMAQEKFSAAQKAYEAAFARRQSDTLAIKLHAARSKAGKTKDANDRLRQWLSEHPDETGSRLYLADVHVKAKQNQLAIDQYQQVLQRDPGNILALANVAALYRQQNDPRALDYLEQGYKLRPDDATIGDRLGWVLVEQGQIARGLELLTKAAAKAPEDPDIRYHLAVALAKSGDEDQARRELDLLLVRNRNFRNREAAQALFKRLEGPGKDAKRD